MAAGCVTVVRAALIGEYHLPHSISIGDHAHNIKTRVEVCISVSASRFYRCKEVMCSPAEFGNRADTPPPCHVWRNLHFTILAD